MKSKLPSHSELSKLANENPEALEMLRKQQVETLINSAPEDYQRRLRGLQFQIDAKRQLHDNPMGACVEISRMMMQSVQKLRETLEGSEDQNLNKAATVLNFAPKRSLA